MPSFSTTSLIAGEPAPAFGPAFTATDPASQSALDPTFHAATATDLEKAAAAALAAFPVYARRPARDRAAFLRAIAQELEARKPALVELATAETGLPGARIEGETGRTCTQLRMFATLVEEGSWVDARLDAALDRGPGLPRKPDLRSLLRPLGPVAVFGASNFPIAFSVAGGDTASALAAGNPVVVKGHPAHPATGALAAQAIAAAVRACGLPSGLFSFLQTSDDRAGIEIGASLVRHPAIRAVGFTGSQRGGRALMDIAAARPEPIPVYAEMGSVNPVFLLPRAIAARAGQLAQGLHASITLGAGQFCTKPGLIFLPQGPAGDAVLAPLRQAMQANPAFVLLTPAIARAFERGVASRGGQALLETTAAELAAHPELGEELFGPAAVVVRHGSRDELLAAARALTGHLTATVHGTDEDLAEAADLVAELADRVGRVVFNGYPTGVEVNSAMVHGGPYPASSGLGSSVGTRAILRFVRPVCFQDAPQQLLPSELRDGNPLGIWRLRDGVPSRD